VDRFNLEKMLEQGTDNALLRFALGTLCLKQKDFEIAVEHLTEAVRQDDEHSASWKQLGKALTALDRIDEAVDAYQKGIEVAGIKGDVQAVKEMKVFLKRLGASSTC
jgi:uncharacterized protein HemY